MPEPSFSEEESERKENDGYGDVACPLLIGVVHLPIDKPKVAGS